MPRSWPRSTRRRTCTSARCTIFEGPPPAYEDLLDHIRSRLHLVPRYRQKLAFPPIETGQAAVGRRPELQPRVPRPPHRAARPGLRGAAPAPRGADLLPAAGPLQAAVGAVADRGPRGRPLRADLQDASRAGGRGAGCRPRHRPVRPEPGAASRSSTTASRGCRTASPAAPSSSPPACAASCARPFELAGGAVSARHPEPSVDSAREARRGRGRGRVGRASTRRPRPR